MFLVGYALGLAIGVCLGMLGAGGAILTIPVLVFFFNIPPVEATTYSLFIVGITAFIGSIGYARLNLFSTKSVLFFGVPSLVSVFFSSRYLLPAIPEEVARFGPAVLSRDVLVMLLFSFLMVFSAIAMIRNSRVIRKDDFKETRRYRYGLVLLVGLVVGIITGILGAGGGFLIIPALVILANLPMKMAVGTSLVLITINSLFGFFAKITIVPSPDWVFLFSFSGLTVAGILSGVFFARFISGEKLKFAFGVFVLILGVVLLGQEIYFM